MQSKEIEVKAKSKNGNGIMDASEAWFNASKGVSFAAINKGDKLVVTYNEGDKGGKFVTTFTKTNVAALPSITPLPAPVTPGVTTSTAPVVTITNSKSKEEMTKADWDAKDLLKSKGGFAHDAATLTAAMSSMKSEDEVKALFTNLYEHILKTVRG